MENSQKSKSDLKCLQLCGFGLVKILKTNSWEDFNVILHKGISMALIQNVIDLSKEEFLNNTQGNSIIPIDDFMIYNYYFQDNNGNIIFVIYMDEKKQQTNYSKLYLITKKINKFFTSNTPISEIINIFNTLIEVPRSEGIIAVFILDPSGTPYYLKINKVKNNVDKNKEAISGFISALHLLSKEIFNKESRVKLKEINVGNHRFYMITRDKVIFAYLVENPDHLIQRYIYLIVDEFLDDYKEVIKNFKGDTSPFNNFENKINQYFII